MTTSNDFELGYNVSNFSTTYDSVDLDVYFQSDVNNDLNNDQQSEISLDDNIGFNHDFILPDEIDDLLHEHNEFNTQQKNIYLK